MLRVLCLYIGLKLKVLQGGIGDVGFIGDFRGGETEALGLEHFTPGFGECKEITDIEVFLHKCAKEEGLSEVFFNVAWQRDSEWSIDPDTLELGDLIEDSTIDNSYFHWKEGKLEEISPSDLLEIEE